jgi:hypothetical protein
VDEPATSSIRDNRCKHACWMLLWHPHQTMPNVRSNCAGATRPSTGATSGMKSPTQQPKPWKHLLHVADVWRPCWCWGAPGDSPACHHGSSCRAAVGPSIPECMLYKLAQLLTPQAACRDCMQAFDLLKHLSCTGCHGLCCRRGVNCSHDIQLRQQLRV